MMRALLSILVGVLAGAGLAWAGGGAPASEKETAKPGVVVADVLDIKALIDAVDFKKRMLTLKSAQGRIVILKADKSVNNFDQFRRGDWVLVEFVDSVAISIRKASLRQNGVDARLVSVAPKGAHRSVLLVETFQLPAIIESIDYKGRMLTVREANRNIRIIAIEKSIKPLEAFKKGEAVVLQITEPIAIKIEKRK
jgi:hypothetical protein